MTLLKNITLSLFITLYMAAGLGVGLHYCTQEGSVALIIMLSDDSCTEAHRHHHADHDASDCDSEHEAHHDSGCCHTEVHQITDVYKVSDLSTNPAPEEIVILSLLIQDFNSSSLANLSTRDVDIVDTFKEGTSTKAILALNSVWRL